jgi:hypothetical protein
MMKDYYQRSMRALQLAGMSERTQECYTRAVRMLADFSGKTPDEITEPELEDYFLHRRNTDKWSAVDPQAAGSCAGSHHLRPRSEPSQLLSISNPANQSPYAGPHRFGLLEQWIESTFQVESILRGSTLCS